MLQNKFETNDLDYRKEYEGASAERGEWSARWGLLTHHGLLKPIQPASFPAEVCSFEAF